MMDSSSNLEITDLTAEERALLNASLLDFNKSKVPFNQDPPFITLSYGLKDRAGSLIGGIIATIYCWGCVYIDSLWIDSNYRRNGYGAMLLKKVEGEARKRDCVLVHLDTFEFQAKEFYLTHGYEIFGVLDDCPTGHSRIYLKKILSR
jgi:GNAT superfamily N-acetyltransferase